ncbi:DUF2243 domain-containing protein [Saccharophagus sp. K07]|jgi:uncharacterized membrane protein|uniref:DUF2243 domain-containing protein n=1 Tax=Saccharophagus sp. K07 TaxID=2283636 RepID=UPI001651B355|nr:DUF2243 domain-containing protein [Saccharophagus sp. K07]MBC6906385.1 DUF2243 domain-containing protein [Saccharophagus sp. K07]
MEKFPLVNCPTGPGILFGIGCMAAVDEIIFHQLLGWHHFYDLATPTFGLLSDGLLHAVELLALIAGFFIFLEQRRRGAADIIAIWAGFFMGAGGFQLFDGTINHKILKLHQIRYGVNNILPYDFAWNVAAILLLIIGVIFFARYRLMHPK